jgi:hypothetical protein
MTSIYYCLTLLVFVGCPHWREDGSVFRICCWPLPAQSFSGSSPLGLDCLRFETSLFVASYDSQGHGESILPRLHTRWTNTVSAFTSLINTLHRSHGKHRLYCWWHHRLRGSAFAEPLLRNGLHNPVVPPVLGADNIENSLIYCYVLDCVYRAVAWQRVDQIRYNIIYFIVFCNAV